MTIRIIINGAKGKMGQLAVKALEKNIAFSLVGQLSRKDNLAEAIQQQQAQIVLDLTNAEAVWQNTLTIIEHHAHPIIGTSGLVSQQIQELQARCTEKKLGGIIAPNFSIGALLMMRYAAHIAKYFSEVEIIEKHHPGKLDSPSGTALRTAELIAEARTTIPADNNHREIIPHARGASYQKIPIHAIRLPGLLAHQEIIFGGSGETLTIRHDTIDRQCFMPGIVLACQKVMALNELIVGLENIL